MRAPRLHPADFLTGEAFAKDVLAHQALIHAIQINLILDLAAQIAQHFHSALVGDVRARRVGQPVIAVDHDVFDAIGRQQSCSR